MVKGTIKITDKLGMHLRPATDLSKAAMDFKSKVRIGFKGNEYNGKSVLSILGACIKYDDEIELICQGEDEELALEKIMSIFEK